MGGFKHTGVAASSALTDYARVTEYQNGDHVAADAGGAADVQTLAVAPSIAAYNKYQRFSFVPVADNTGACTLNVSSVGAKDVKLVNGEDPSAGDLDATGIAEVIYDGTNFILLNPATVTGQLRPSTKTIAKALTPVDDVVIYPTGSDGGPFIGGTGKAAGYYDDDSVLGYGTRFKPTGGDGSAGWERDYKGPVLGEWFKTVGDGDGVGGGTDNYTAITEAYAVKNSIYLTKATYRCDTRLDFVSSTDIEILADKGTAIDCTNVTTKYAVWISGQAMPASEATENLYDRALRTGGQALGADVVAGDYVLNVPIALGLVKGSIIRISSSVLFNPQNSAAFSGEMAEVDTVSGTTVTLKSGLADAYTAATTTVFKLVMPTVIAKNFKVIRDSNDHGFTVWEAKDLDIDGVDCEGARLVSTEYLYCFGGKITNCKSSDAWYSGTGESYGISVASSQSLMVTGNRIYDGRHAFTIGGYEPCRYNVITDNYFSVLPGRGSGAFDMHSNSQYNTVTDNIIHGGAHFSGVDTIFSNNQVFQYPSTVANGNYGIYAFFERDAQYCIIDNNTVVSYGDGTAVLGDGGFSFIQAKWEGTNSTVDYLRFKGNKANGQIGFAHGGLWVSPLAAGWTGNAIKRLEFIDNDITVEAGSSSSSKALSINENTYAGVFTVIDECIVHGGRYEDNTGRCVDIVCDSTSGFLDIKDAFFLYGAGCIFTQATNNFSDLVFENNRVKRTSVGAGAVEFWGHDTAKVTSNLFVNMTATNFLDIRNATDVIEGNHRLIGTTGSVSVLTLTNVDVSNIQQWT